MKRILNYAYLFLFLFLAAGISQADNLDVELLRQTPKVMKYLRSKGYENVGVLSFRVQREGKKPTMRGTLLNNNMADRLENALIMSIDPEHPVQIIDDARETAADSIRGASYRTATDRKRLFDVSYNLPIESKRKVTADALVSGKVKISDDLAKTQVTIESFDSRNPQVYTKIHQFEVDTDRYILSDLGQGFSMSRRGVRFARGSSSADTDDIIEGVIEEIEDFEDDHELDEEDYPAAFPLELSVRYDDRVTPLEFDSEMGPNNWKVKDPNQGTKVEFDVKNVTNETIGLVLTVNGVSTLYEQEGQPNQLKRWILEPNKTYRIKGFYGEDNQTYQPIIGLSDSDSESLYDDLGGSGVAGLIHAYVFREQIDAPAVASAGAGFSRGSLRSVSPKQLKRRDPQSWAEMQRQIAEGMAMKSGRGLMVSAVETKQEQLKLKDLASVGLTDTMVVRYYAPEEKVASDEAPNSESESEAETVSTDADSSAKQGG